MSYLDDVMRLMLAATRDEPEEQRIETIRAALNCAYRRVQNKSTFQTDREWERIMDRAHGFRQYRVN